MRPMSAKSRLWKPNVTVAAVIERDGKFLLVEERVKDENNRDVMRWNQPAGHLDEGESLLAACAREVLEETAWHFVPRELVGIYQWRRPQGDITYLRFAIAANWSRRSARWMPVSSGAVVDAGGNRGRS